MGFKVNVDNSTIQSDENNRLSIKISANENNGLSFDENGKLIATKTPPIPPSPSSTINISGNGVGPSSNTVSDPLYTVGMNSTVSRHKSYNGSNMFIINNEGVKMSTVENGSIVDGLAYYMINS